MAEYRHWTDRIQMAFFTHEGSYNTATAVWDATTACTLTDLDNAAPHEQLNDNVVGADLVRQSHTGPTEQAIASQSVRIPYATPRCVPNVLAGMLGVTLGRVQTTQQGFAPAYRHKITPAALDALPSITAILQHQNGDSWIYPGLKGESWTLRHNNAFLALESPLVGSGQRTQTIATWAPLVGEDWLLVGQCRISLRDLSSTPLTLPIDPVQNAPNLGSGTTLLSERVLGLQVSCRNTLALDDYRVTSGLVRSQLHVMSRVITVTLTLEINRADPVTSDEAVLLAWYFTQHPFAVEWQCTGAVIFPTSVSSMGPLGAVAYLIRDEFLTPYYLTVNFNGNLSISAVAPGVGTIYDAGFGPIVRGENGLKYQLTVVVLDGEPQLVHVELGDPPDPSTLEYFSLQDETVQTWRLWYIGPPGSAVLERELSPPVAGTDYRWGFDLLLPRVVWAPPVRGESGNFDTLQFTGTALEYGSDPAMVAWIWNRQPAYLA